MIVFVFLCKAEDCADLVLNVLNRLLLPFLSFFIIPLPPSVDAYARIDHRVQYVGKEVTKQYKYRYECKVKHRKRYIARYH